MPRHRRSAAAEQGTTAAVIGPSGSGKTTLALHAIAEVTLANLDHFAAGERSGNEVLPTG